MDIYMKIKLTIGLLYFLQTLIHIQGEYTYTYVGCYVDREDRALSGEHYMGYRSNTIEKCVDFCGERSYTYAGLQYRDECWCGNSSYGKYGVGGGCILRCTGNYHQICGGNWRNSVFAIQGVTKTTTTTTTAAKAATSSAATYPKETATTTSNAATNIEVSAKAGGKRNLGVYIGIGLITVVACATIVLVVVLVVGRRRYSRENNGMSCQMAASNIYVDVPSVGQSDKPTSESRNDTALLHYTVANGDVYTVPQRSSKNNQ